MTMQLTATAAELRKALADIEQAEANGFMHCEAVFYVASAGRCLDQCKLAYSDLSERGHPTDARYNWGRFQGVTRHNRWDPDTKTLTPISPPPPPAIRPRD